METAEKLLLGEKAKQDTANLGQQRVDEQRPLELTEGGDWLLINKNDVWLLPFMPNDVEWGKELTRRARKKIKDELRQKREDEKAARAQARADAKRKAAEKRAEKAREREAARQALRQKDQNQGESSDEAFKTPKIRVSAPANLPSGSLKRGRDDTPVMPPKKRRTKYLLPATPEEENESEFENDENSNGGFPKVTTP